MSDYQDPAELRSIAHRIACHKNPGIEGAPRARDPRAVSILERATAQLLDLADRIDEELAKAAVVRAQRKLDTVRAKRKATREA